MRYAATVTVPAFLTAWAVLTSSLGQLPAAEPAADAYAVGVARVDITPNYPVRLSGFGFRRAESEGVTQRIWAKALAIGADEPAVLIAVESCGVPARLVNEVAARLAQTANLRRERLAVTSTHTHTAPMLGGVLSTLFGQPIPKEHQEHIDRYTAELTDKLEQVALAALADRKPARLSWGIGKVGFAINRRTKGGPVDHDFPVLTVRDLQGKLRAVYVNYACHCVTLSNNKISGDWAGFAQEQIQDENPGAIALLSVGCGADSNPSSGVMKDRVDIAQRQGAEVAVEVKRLLAGYLAPVTGRLTTGWRQIDLPLAALPTREEWEKRAARKGAVGYKGAIGYHARVQLARLDRGEALRTKFDYPIQTWTFGDSLALVFLPGEVVVDYALRLKRELDPLRLWLNAYANDVPAYIPSERVLKEGGYEGGGAMVYYDVPAPFKPGLEQRIIGAVHELLGRRFQPPYEPQHLGGSRPLSPQQSLATIRTKKDLAVELVAAEPLVIDPVAIDWGPDGRLWVAEMNDYPAGRDGNYQPGGRVRVLEDTDGDGKYDRATVFLDNIPFPTGVTVWRKGVLVCAAPDILYAEDTNGDGKADVVKKLYSGFGTDNFQARVNSLEYGLDGWVHGSCGAYGGTIRRFAGDPVRLGNRDFRIQPDTGALEAASGRTQQGRVRDDWGDWFGCDNSNLCRHYPLADHYLRRNPHAAPPRTSVFIPADGQRLFPLQNKMQLFKLSGPPGFTTAACGLGIYRDERLGKEYAGNAFVCEPVNLLVHRMVLSPKGSTFTSRRTADEAESEFLAATDTWFRPVQARTGPDGALWVVDMYRYVIEHPRWIPAEDLKQLDLRAGSTMGRIYRVVPKAGGDRTVPRLDKLDTAGLVAALDSPNGWQRDLAMQLLLWKPDPAAVEPLQTLALSSERAEARLHALCTLGALGRLQPAVVRQALADPHPGVRRHAIRLAEPLLTQAPNLGPALLRLVVDRDPQVRLQLAYTLGEWTDPRAGPALVALVLPHADDVYLTAAVLSSVNRHNLAAILEGTFASSNRDHAPVAFMQRLLGVAVGLGDQENLARVFQRLTTPRDGRFAPRQAAALAGAAEALERKGQTFDRRLNETARMQFWRLLNQARTTALDVQAPEAERLTMLHVLGRDQAQRELDLETLVKLLVPQNPAAIQAGALTALGRIPTDESARAIIGGWRGYSPALKAQALDLLLSRGDWQRQLVEAVGKGAVPAGHIDVRRRQRLLAHKDEQVRALAAKLLSGGGATDRQKVVRDYQSAASLPADATRGKAVFTKSCVTCHKLNDVGAAVGPDLAALANKTPQYLLAEILDPNRNVDPRYVEYVATTKAGRTFTGVLAAETATSIILRGQEGKEQVLLRGELDELASTGKSLMPEGLEKDLSRQNLADLMAYLSAGDSPTPADAADLARDLLDERQSAKERQAIIDRHPELAVALIQAMTADLRPGTKEEYVRIPWIWRVAVAAGKRNDVEQIRHLLAAVLPKAGAPLHDWQAVVIGGGLINGISQRGVWPRERLRQIIGGDAGLAARWQKALEQAAAMADNDKVPTGTRYDALRIIPLDGWDRRGEQLAKYLKKGVHPELQMGAISGLSDVDSPRVAPLLLSGIDDYSPVNRKLALDALLRDDARIAALLDALEQSRVKASALSPGQQKALRALKNERLRERAEKVLSRQ
jgi:putative membrane-bound dehydrogenase-like protein